MKLTGLKPGPALGRVIKGTVDWILDNNIKLKDKKKIETFIKEF